MIIFFKILIKVYESGPHIQKTILQSDLSFLKDFDLLLQLVAFTNIRDSPEFTGMKQLCQEYRTARPRY